LFTWACSFGCVALTDQYGLAGAILQEKWSRALIWHATTYAVLLKSGVGQDLGKLEVLPLHILRFIKIVAEGDGNIRR
jgi:hypothetical protein